MEFLEQVFIELSPYIPRLEAARDYAEDQYDSVPDNIKAQARRRSQSSLMNDFIVAGLRKTLLGSPGVSTYDKYGQTIIAIGLSECTVNLKCKKVNKRLRISFIPTQMAMKFMNNPVCQSSYLNPVINLIVGVLWNDISTKIEKIYLLHPYDPNHFDWECDIAQPIVEMQKPPMPAESTDSRPPKKRVTPKKMRRHSNKERGASDEPETGEPRDDNTST
jgi:hypothetical protein